MSASTPATPPALTVQKIINTIKCSLQFWMKSSHLGAGQGGKQSPNLQRSPQKQHRRSATECTPQNQRDQSQGTLSLGSHTQNVLRTSRQLLGHIKTTSGCSSHGKGFVFSQAEAGGGWGWGEQCKLLPTAGADPSTATAFWVCFKLQCIRVHIPEWKQSKPQNKLHSLTN